MVLIHAKHLLFDKEEAKKLFLINQKAIENQREFESYLTKWFFNIYDSQGFVGCIFCYHENNHDWVGGFAKRKRHYSCLEALLRVRNCFSEIYASTKQLSAKIILRKAGFVPTDKAGIYVFKKCFSEGENK